MKFKGIKGGCVDLSNTLTLSKCRACIEVEDCEGVVFRNIFVHAVPQKLSQKIRLSITAIKFIWSKTP